MTSTRTFTALIERQDDGYVALCPELDVASQGATVEEARLNLIEAIELYFETVSPEEVRSRVNGEFFITRVVVKIAEPAATLGSQGLPGAGDARVR